MNVKQYKVDKLKQAEKLNPEQRSTRLLKEIQETLHLPKLTGSYRVFRQFQYTGKRRGSCVCRLQNGETIEKTITGNTTSKRLSARTTMPP